MTTTNSLEEIKQCIMDRIQRINNRDIKFLLCMEEITAAHVARVEKMEGNHEK
jgi:hypothetical protein